MESAIVFILGVLVGSVISIFILFKLSPGLMLREKSSKFDFDETLKQLQDKIDKMGWKTPHIHDLQATMAKFNFKVRKVKVMEICKPDYAHMVLSQDDERIASNMMPCRISVYEKSDGNTYVSYMNGTLMGSVFGGIIKKAMSKAGNENEEIIKSVAI